MGPDGQERINGDKTLWLMRKVRKLIKAVNILEEQHVKGMADLEANISSNSADLKANDLHISDIQVSTYKGYYHLVQIIVPYPDDPVLYLKQAKIQTNAGGIQILEEQLVKVNETMVMDMADLEANISSNSADLKANDLHISDIQVSTCNSYYYLVQIIVPCPG